MPSIWFSLLLSRRNFLAFAGFGAASALSGCASYPSYGGPVVQTVQYGDPAYNTFGGAQPIGGYYEQGYGGPQPDPAYMYAAMNDEGHELPAIPYQQIDPRYYRQHVPNPTGQPAGTVVVDPNNRFLYVVENNAHRHALRHRRRPPGLRMGRRGGHSVAAEMAALEPAGRNGRAPAGTGQIFDRQRRHGSRA